MKRLRTHGITKNPSEMKNKSDGGWYYEMQDLGHNMRLPDILCALGTSQLKRMNENLTSRRKIARRYQDELKGLPVVTPFVDEDMAHAYHLFVILTDKRKALYDHLVSKKIFAQVHYIPIYKQPYYQARYGKTSKPQCDTFYENCLSLPMYHSLTDADQNRVISEIRLFFQGSKLSTSANG